MTRRGRFITLEGGEGGGKSTHAKWMAEWLSARGREVVTTREPGGSPLAEAVRKLFLADWEEGMDGKTETLLLFAARAAHIRNTIEPALSAGRDVVCDRFIDASHAYQGAGRGVQTDILSSLETWVLGKTRPDLTFILDLAPATGLERTRQRGIENRFETENPAFMERVRDAYLERARSAPDRYVIIDASQSIERVRQQLQQALERKL